MAINQKYEQEYNNHPEWSHPPGMNKFCEGRVIFCPEVTLSEFVVQCRSNRCTPILKLANQPVSDKSTWQTYRNDEFGFEVKHPHWGEVGTVAFDSPFA
ncbi:MAG: hypothetical protein AAB524_00365, partial [Patescibacteria group bacterium]